MACKTLRPSPSGRSAQGVGWEHRSAPSPPHYYHHHPTSLVLTVKRRRHSAGSRSKSLRLDLTEPFVMPSWAACGRVCLARGLAEVWEAGGPAMADFGASFRMTSSCCHSGDLNSGLTTIGVSLQEAPMGIGELKPVEVLLCRDHSQPVAAAQKTEHSPSALLKASSKKDCIAV